MPNNKVMVQFDLTESDQGDLSVGNIAYSLDGTLYNAASQLSGVHLPLIDNIRFNINDAQAVYPYYIAFENCTVDAPAGVINVEKVSFVYPWPSVNELENVQIVRVE